MGCVNASSSPASGFASTCRAARPSTIPSTALEARRPAASLSSFVNSLSARKQPIRTITTNTSLRTTRSLVFAARETPASLTRPATWPACARTKRSTMYAIANVIASVIAAPITSSYSCQKVWSCIGPDPVKLPRSMATSSTKAVFLDALGTLVELEPPWVHLAAELGVEPSDDLARAVRKEMDYYREHSHEGRDEASVAALRARCADILSWELDREIPVVTMMASIRF